jgi:hypothetical protein
MFLGLAIAVVGLVGGVGVSPVAAAPVTRYVKPTGFDIKFIGGTPIPNLSCSQANPCRSIKWAAELVANAGDTVSVAAGTYNNRVTIGKNITIRGAGAGSTIVDGGTGGSVFQVTSGVNAKIKTLRIRHGKAAQGGGVFVAGGATLAMTSVTLIDNQANSGGGITNYGTLSLTKVRLEGNHGTSNAGGGLANNGTATLDRTDIKGNDAAYGAGIYNSGGTLTITNSAIHHNTTASGYPGIYNSGGTLKLTNVTISANTSGSGSNQGGAISQTSGSATLNYVTIAGNVQGHFGAIYNSSGSVITSNSIVYGNGTSAQCGTASPGAFSDGGYNVMADASCVVWPGSGSTIANPGLKVLANYGGFTPTRALKSTSPAIDRVPKVKCVAKDQRGVARPKDGNGDGIAKCDSGAYEYP